MWFTESYLYNRFCINRSPQMGFWGDFGVGAKIFGGKVHPSLELRVFRHLWSTLTRRAVAFCMDIAICHVVVRSRPKFRERCHPLTCPSIPNLVWIGCVLPDLFRKDWFFGTKSWYNIGLQPTVIQMPMFMVLLSSQNHCESSPDSFDEFRMAPSGRRPSDQAKRLGLRVRL